MALVVCISSNESLAITRRMLLEDAGHRVITAFNIQEIERACKQSPEVAVIGQGIARSERARIHDLVRRLCPATKILELYSPTTGKNLADADDWLSVPADVPTDLGERVSALAEKSR